jgi:organic radical activating enzyme
MTKPYIKMFDIYYGTKCNLACRHCDTRSDIIRTTETDPHIDTILQGITLAKEKFDIDLYSFIGGEPLYYLDKIEIILAHIRKIDPTAKIQVSTNGALLSKNLDAVVSLMITYETSLFVCNHFAAFDDKMTNRITESVNQLVDRLQLNKGDANIFLSRLLRLDNPRNDPYLDTWIEQQGEYFLGEQPLDHYYHDDKIFVHFRPQTDFKMHHYMQNGKPKPFMTGDSALSYKDGCSSPMCSFMIDKKLYKCSALGTLERFLEYHGSLEDPDWQKYRNYKYLDLETCTEEEAIQFHATKYCSILECDMCGTSSFNRTREDVIHVHRR